MNFIVLCGTSVINFIQMIPASAIALTVFCPCRFTIQSVVFSLAIKIISTILSCAISVLSISPLSIIFLFFMALGSICVSSFIIKPHGRSSQIQRFGKYGRFSRSISVINVKELFSVSDRQQDAESEILDRSNTNQLSLLSNKELHKIFRKMVKKSKKYIRPVGTKLSSLYMESIENFSNNPNLTRILKRDDCETSDSRARFGEYTSPILNSLNTSYQPFSQWLKVQNNNFNMQTIDLFRNDWLDSNSNYGQNLDDFYVSTKFGANISSLVRYHYACPPTTLETLRKRYGTSRSLWGEWSNKETRNFYKTQLPLSLQSQSHLLFYCLSSIDYLNFLMFIQLHS